MLDEVQQTENGNNRGRLMRRPLWVTTKLYWDIDDADSPRNRENRQAMEQLLRVNAATTMTEDEQEPDSNSEKRDLGDEVEETLPGPCEEMEAFQQASLALRNRAGVPSLASRPKEVEQEEPSPWVVAVWARQEKARRRNQRRQAGARRAARRREEMAQGNWDE